MFSFVGARGPGARIASMLSAARRSFTTVADEVAAANLKGFGIFALKQTNDKGWGIFALSNIPRFTTVFKASSLARGPVCCSHSVQLDWDTHVQMDLPAFSGAFTHIGAFSGAFLQKMTSFFSKSDPLWVVGTTEK
jgi:hypothetical protein